ncbi:MAG: winged helix-turn-helix domain-containing protein [Candidatus Nanoarchaeia archaeon]|nr:winged helix-turn-helix domain-containing protein [Candidatus Nanoarchaeia archaeon]
MTLTQNEKKVLRLLAASRNEDYSINEIAKQCGITPNGAYKILVKLEKEGILKKKQIANIIAYKLNFDNEKTMLMLELSFVPDILEGRVKLRAEDLEPLKAVAKACIVFGSYITPKQKPGDIDIMFILDKSQFQDYKKKLSNVQDIMPVKIQDVVQTDEDLQQNLKKGDVIVKEALQNGIVLWGYKTITEAVKNAGQA